VTSTSLGLRHLAFAALLALADRCSGDSFAAFARAAFRAIALRRRADNFSRVAAPPFDPISFKNERVTRCAMYAPAATLRGRCFRGTKCR